VNNPLRNLEDYELFIYSLVAQFPSIRRSTVVVIRRGATLVRVEGELYFDRGVRVVIRERLTFNRLPGIIDWYGYEVWRDEEKIFWYDSQPHPNEPSLQQNHPHHKHIPPDAKHNRVPAIKMSFIVPNIPEIIQEIETLLSPK
jgi:hypothetical protein